MKENLSGALRLALFSLLLCSGIYPLVIWGAAQLLVPDTADGSLIRDRKGTVIGSAALAQEFQSPRYFHGRPSAVRCNAAGSGGSNLSSASPELRKRVERTLEKLSPADGRPVPADLLTASGSGLDPHLTKAAAVYQIPRIAAARKISPETIGKLVDSSVLYPGGILRAEPLVNVLELNIKLDELN